MHFKRILLIIGTAIALSSPVYAKEIAIIVGKNHPLTHVSAAELADIYLGNKEVAGKVRLKPIDQRDGQEIHSAFLKKVLRMSHDDYVEYWNHRLFREGGTPPILKGDSTEVIRSVEEKEGAIGYVWASEGRDDDNVRILLTIDTHE